MVASLVTLWARAFYRIMNSTLHWRIVELSEDTSQEARDEKFTKEACRLLMTYDARFDEMIHQCW
jgi:hypothetical protein